MKNITLSRKNEKSLEKESLRCPGSDSPNGAHWWIKDKGKPLWRCQWCPGVLHGLDPWSKKKKIKSLPEGKIISQETIKQDLNVQEAAEELGISRAMVYTLISDKKLAAKMVRIGYQKMWTINRKEVNRAKREMDIEKEKEEFRNMARRKASN